MSEPHGGSLVDEAQRAWVVANKGPQHVVACARCGLDFYSARLRADVCWGCWYELEMEQAATDFTPLSTHLERLLEVKTTVDQTGGMTMCLRVPIGHEVEGVGTLKWAWFSRLCENPPGLGLYEVGEDGEYLDGDDGCGDYREWPGEFVCGEPEHRACEWYHHPKLAEEVALWAAPIIVEFATKEETP